MVSINFDAKTVLNFYETKSDQQPIKTISFFNDPTINSWNIKNINEQQEWLKPEVLWLDYFMLTFRCTATTENWLQVIVNNESGEKYWLNKSELTTYKSWETYLKEMFSVERNSDKSQKIRTSPTDNSSEIAHNEQDCFIVKSMKGDWIEIVKPDYCEGDSTKAITGWIRWKDGNNLLIDYFITS